MNPIGPPTAGGHGSLSTITPGMLVLNHEFDNCAASDDDQRDGFKPAATIMPATMYNTQFIPTTEYEDVSLIRLPITNSHGFPSTITSSMLVLNKFHNSMVWSLMMAKEAA